ncbi:MAG: 5-formyltetrahydrofolate cyclo-ligase [Oscillospiraceae bacterium]|jgi:5-formyltetrahydrofolate cyclo-ligase|nr:5-formyltetrahydrofolate cyclo-ligase [Oscillospiraceae bacterium]
MKIDIRHIKNNLRQRMKSYRRELPKAEKTEYDSSILSDFLNCYAYKHSSMVLVYVSTDIEVDTKAVIKAALSDGKRVACPRCINNTFLMDFYFISGIEDLSPGTFGVLEPAAKEENKVTDFKNSVCVVPGLAFDYSGFRLGYGKGYYDRFLAGYNGFTVGFCYSECILRRLPHGRYDRSIGLLITEKYKRRCYGDNPPERKNGFRKRRDNT